MGHFFSKKYCVYSMEPTFSGWTHKHEYVEFTFNLKMVIFADFTAIEKANSKRAYLDICIMFNIKMVIFEATAIAKSVSVLTGVG